MGHVILCITEIADNFLFTLLTSEFNELGDLQKYFRICVYFLVLFSLPLQLSVILKFICLVNFSPHLCILNRGDGQQCVGDSDVSKLIC